MPNFFVDPLLCTTPESHADPSEVARWLAALEGWLAALEGSPFDWRHFLLCTDALREVGRFPTFDSLRTDARRADVDVNVGGLLQRLMHFFQNETRDLLAITATRCVVVSEAEPSIAPPEVLTRNLAKVRLALQDGLLCLACDKAEGEPFAKEARLVTSPFKDSSKEVSVEGTIDLVDPESRAERLHGQVLRESFPVLFSPDDLSAFTYEALLVGGEHRVCSLITSMATSLYPESHLLAASAGSQFWRSLHKTGIIEDTFAIGKLLRICAAILASRVDDMNVERRPKRETGSPDSAQQTRKSDKAKAWRLTITKASAGYRLHYWHIPARADQPEQIELANVLRERDPVVIPEN
jgi:hypothetical protein